MLLVSIYGFFVNRESCVWEVFVVIVVVYKKFEFEIRSYKVIVFEVYILFVGFIGKVIFQWCVELLVYVSVFII